MREWSVTILLCSALCLSFSCRREEDVRVIRVAKANRPTSTRASVEKIEWTVPSAWKAVPPGPMRYATFALDDQGLFLTVVRLTGPQAGSIQANVNRWQRELDLPESPPQDIAGIVRHLEVASLRFDVVDIRSEKRRILAALLDRGHEVWSFKIVGPPDAVEPQKESFEEFLTSVRFAASQTP